MRALMILAALAVAGPAAAQCPNAGAAGACPAQSVRVERQTVTYTVPAAPPVTYVVREAPPVRLAAPVVYLPAAAPPATVEYHYGPFGRLRRVVAR